MSERKNITSIPDTPEKEPDRLKTAFNRYSGTLLCGAILATGAIDYALTGPATQAVHTHIIPHINTYTVTGSALGLIFSLMPSAFVVGASAMANASGNDDSQSARAANLITPPLILLIMATCAFAGFKTGSVAKEAFAENKNPDPQKTSHILRVEKSTYNI